MKRKSTRIASETVRKVLVRGGENGQYVASGHLVYNRADELIGVPFDVAALQISGEPRRLGDFVRNHVEGAQFAISDAGHLAYVQGASNRQERRLVRVRSDGSVEPLSAPVREYQTVALSADGRFVAAGAAGETNQVAIFDTTRATFTPLVTGAGSSQAPLWTPDGRRITYRGTRAGFRNVWWKTVGDGTSEERLTTGENIQTPAAWTPDASWLVYLENALATGQDIWAMPMTGDRKPRVIVRTPLADGSPRLSPDGKWLAYMSQASGSAEVFVQSFPSPNAITQVSVDGGSEPAWSRDGRQIFYRRGDDMMAADVRTTPTFSADRPRKLYTGSFFPSPTANTGYDVMPDGSLIRIQSLHPDPPSNRITVVLNWIEELTRQVPH